MNTKSVAALQHRTFESIKQLNEDDSEFWFARELAPLLDYQDWRNFLQVIEKAKVACDRSGHPVRDHFGGVTKMVVLGSGAKRGISDYTLSRYACYLIVQNGDPSKPVIANGQTYFALQTRRQELGDEKAFAGMSEGCGTRCGRGDSRRLRRVPGPWLPRPVTVVWEPGKFIRVKA
ncbi:BRO family protein [Paraburkholderia saeva]|uniref:Bro-N domain-containing protein n=1 Tax=Paraburkholderia saeva TaxID=2777537 RepID=A0A9N8RTX8_9BURK|nr:BRO family protein [Paraburkholderia saeva]CAG4892448.1 hypothetical protein LMG31841_01622 [Paraburkholderia saeva]